ncbi:MAG: non-homologous end-joining DNA ligase [Actinomycetota bacterium]|nr:non-homologous end-joining DNA ligase [Actinomycetota bacterium]
MPTPAIELDAGGRTVRVSNPDKVYFPAVGLTKRDVVEYYLAVGNGLLAALFQRPTTLKRYVDGVEGEAFYQKRMAKSAPDWVQSVEIAFPSGRTAYELCPTHVADLAWAANLGTFDFHPWPVRRGDVDHPDELRLDLDPQPGTDFADAARVADEVRAVMDELGWTGYPKSSGGRGIHIAVRLQPQWTFTEVRRAVIAFARMVERRRPDLVTTSWWKEERGQRVFIDFNQACRDRTIASAYSVRGTPRATVSAPLRWDELAQVDPDDFTVQTMPGRYAEVGDLLAGIEQTAHSLEPLLEQAERDLADRGLGDLPYPPDYPKMPGEPMRVQPSRAKKLPAD